MRSTARAARCGAVAVAVAVAAGQPTTGAATTPDSDGRNTSVVIVLDASTAMLDDLGGGASKVEATRTALGSLIGEIDDDLRIGLRQFGGGIDAPSACEDSRPLAPVGSDNVDSLAGALDRYQAAGESTVGFALQRAAADLGTEGRRTVLLVAGRGDTCGVDACDVARDLSEVDHLITIDVIGVDVDGADRDSLRCIATAGHGRYFDADSTTTIEAALTRLVGAVARPPTASTPTSGTPTPAGAPELAPGARYLDAFAKNDTTLYYTVRRHSRGSTLHIGVVAPLGPIDTSSLPTNGHVRLEATTVDGGFCGWINETSISGSWNAIALQESVWASGPCADDDILVLSVTPSGWERDIAGTRFELAIAEEPGVVPGTELPPATATDELTWDPMAVDGAAGPVAAGATFDDAPELTPGSYTADIIAGETSFFRVPLEWGERLQVQADFPRPVQYLDAFDPWLDASIGVFSPNRGPVTEFSTDGTNAVSEDALTYDATTRLATATALVRWWNRDECCGPQHANVPGDYYVAVSVAGSPEGDAAVIPYALTVDVLGSPGDGTPPYSGDTSATSGTGPVATSDAADSTTAAGTTMVPHEVPSADADDDAVAAPVIGALGLVGLVLVGRGVYQLVRRRPVDG